MAKQMGFVFFADFCIGCRACEVACRNENGTPSSVKWRKVTQLADKTYLSISCNHCSSPECFRVCPTNAFTKRSDGIVQINSELCTGCELCITACPYQTPQYDIETHKVSKCEMCYQRQDKGLEPACVEACSTQALRLEDLNLFCHQQASAEIPGLVDSRLTDPSFAYYPASRKRRRYFLTQ